MIQKVVRGFSSLKLTVVCLFLLMVLVFWGTLAQINMGIYYTQKTFFQSAFVWWEITPTFKLPIFPGGFLVGNILCINLIAAHFTRFKWTLKKSGIWLTHIGLILLLIGGGLSHYKAQEYQMPIQIGETKAYATSFQDIELAILCDTGPDTQTVTSIPVSFLQKNTPISTNSLPFTLKTLQYLPNAAISLASAGSKPAASQGIGIQLNVAPKPIDKQEITDNAPTAIIELFNGQKSLGTWVVSTGLGAPQSVEMGHKKYTLYLRRKHLYFPFTVQLKEFHHDVYPGTNIPKNFSSKVEVQYPSKKETKAAIIYMNNPLRYEGYTFYQASFGNNDTLSVFQVVKNPSWLIPYIACFLIFLGLLIHFGMMLVQHVRKA